MLLLANPQTHGCNVQLMGNSRLQRGLNYMSFLKDADPAGEGSPFGFFHGGCACKAGITP